MQVEDCRATGRDHVRNKTPTAPLPETKAEESFENHGNKTRGQVRDIPFGIGAAQKQKHMIRWVRTVGARKSISSHPSDAAMTLFLL